MAAIAVGKEAPAFELTSMTGERYSLPKALARGPALVVFFKVACSTCQYAFPYVERIHQQWRTSGAQIWGISQDDAEHTRRFAEHYGVTLPLLIDDPPYTTSRAYGVKFTPTLLLLAPSGRVELSGDGFSKFDLNQIQQRLARHFSVAAPALFRPDEKIPEYKPG